MEREAWPGTRGPAFPTPKPWPEALQLGEQLTQPIPRVRLEALVFGGFFVFLLLLLLSSCSTHQVQGVSGTWKNADKRSSSSLEGEDGNFWAQ